MLEPIVFVR